MSQYSVFFPRNIAFLSNSPRSCLVCLRKRTASCSRNGAAGRLRPERRTGLLLPAPQPRAFRPATSRSAGSCAQSFFSGHPHRDPGCSGADGRGPKEPASGRGESAPPRAPRVFTDTVQRPRSRAPAGTGPPSFSQPEPTNLHRRGRTTRTGAPARPRLCVCVCARV